MRAPVRKLYANTHSWNEYGKVPEHQYEICCKISHTLPESIAEYVLLIWILCFIFLRGEENADDQWSRPNRRNWWKQQAGQGRLIREIQQDSQKDGWFLGIKRWLQRQCQTDFSAEYRQFDSVWIPFFFFFFYFGGVLVCITGQQKIRINGSLCR